jgi:hypothetical protein
VFASCYSSSYHAGSPCDEAHPCPNGLVCSDASQTCELTNTSPLDGPIDSPILIDGCTPVPEICGDGIDQDCDGNDPPCPSNDKAAGAIDIGAGGTFTADLRYAGNDSTKPNGLNQVCGGQGGRDVYYKIHLDSDEALYLDTFGSDFDSVIRVFHGACFDGMSPSPGTVCHNDACASKQTQAIWDLSAGDNCVVVDQFSSSETNGSLVLHVERGKRSGMPIDLGTAVTGDTSTGTDQSTAGCVHVAPDLGYHFTACPGDSLAITATTCNATLNFDSALYARQANGSSPQTGLSCNDDDANCSLNLGASTISFTAQDAHLFWIIVDAGSDNVTGMFELDTSIQ